MCAVVQEIEPASAAFPGPYAASRIKNGEVGTWTGTHVNANTSDGSFVYYATVLAPDEKILSIMWVQSSEMDKFIQRDFYIKGLMSQ